MAERPSYRHGRILWGYLRSNLTGKREMHPAIVLDRDGDITQPEEFDPRKAPYDNVVHVIGVSTKHKKYDLNYIPLPFAPSGHPVTGFKTDCGAIIAWYARLFIPDDVTGSNGGFGGDVPAAVMHRIIEAVREDLSQKLGRQFDTIQTMFQELLGEVD
jgi:hypothetical protein